MNYLLLENKPTIKFGDEIAIDLLHKTYDFNKSFNGDFLIVNEYYVARPDLISLAKYGEDRFADIICKVNGISNPFELNEGMILFIPSYESIYNLLNTKDKHRQTKLINDDDDIINVQKIGDQRNKNEGRNPMNQVVGDTNYIIDRSLGVVFY